jgi:hypothetical protein
MKEKKKKMMISKSPQRSDCTQSVANCITDPLSLPLRPLDKYAKF